MQRSRTGRRRGRVGLGYESPLRHGIDAEDIEHAVRNAMAIDDLDDELRLYLGPSRTATMLEVITVVRSDDRRELVIHAMTMRTKFQRLLPGA
jgi:hypothetical protein